ncbi:MULTISPECIES: patatin-like phospholipase family protein [Frankia]|uniref:patatin-like phospholipase family protein n=1 Tax=Frankia TaxID=1854 RepID=UPI0005A4F98E|nr:MULTISPECIES: patatin-like phospholipase family protein [Frankia]
MTFALVLCGGGVAGVAWELGVLRGIADVDEPLAARLLAADTVIGTSAGSTVAAQITGDTPLAALYDRQLAPSSSELDIELDLTELASRLGTAVGGARDAADRRRRIGALALATDTVSEATRRAVIAGRLDSDLWPVRDLRILAVDAATGELVVFTRDCGVGLVDAVTASCAVPGVWPPATIGGRRYVDGGVRSASNADLARGAQAVLVLTPSPPGQPGAWGDLGAELSCLAPARTNVVFADEESIDAFGANPLSVATRGPSARAGRIVGRAAAQTVGTFLNPKQ